MKITILFFSITLSCYSFASERDCDELNHPDYQAEYVVCLETSKPYAKKNCKDLANSKFRDEYISCLRIDQGLSAKEVDNCDSKKNKDCVNDAKSGISNLRRDVKKFEYDTKSIVKPATSLGK